MAARGAKPKPAHLQIVDGTRNTTRHGSEEDLRKKVEGSIKAFGPLIMPRELRGSAAKAWKSWIAPAPWLDASRTVAAVRFCQLWAESQVNPMGFPASKDGQLRAYMSELGLTDERNRGGMDDRQEKDEFFGD